MTSKTATTKATTNLRNARKILRQTCTHPKTIGLADGVAVCTVCEAVFR